MRKIKIFFFLLTKAKFVFKEPNHTKVVIIDPIYSVDSKNTARIQESHIFLGHYIFENVEELFLRG